MKLLLLGMNYAPERTGIAPYTTELCEYLVQRGHTVTVATTFPHYPEWKTFKGYEGKWAQTEVLNGVRLKRKAVLLPKRATTLRRILYDTSLGAGALLSGIGREKYDLILGVEPPIQAGVAARLVARMRGVPYVLLVQDLALEAAMSVGMMRESMAMRMARRLEHWGFSGAKRIIVISEGFVENLLRKGVLQEKLALLPDWVDPSAFDAASRGNGFRHAHGISENALLVLHSGNMGVKQQLDNVLFTAACLQNHSEIAFVFVGDGSQKSDLMQQAQREQLHNVQFLPLQPSAEVPHMLAAADILILKQHPDMVEAVIPSKLLMYMAAGRPVVVAAHPDSEATRQVRAADCGVWVAPAQPGALADAILRLGADSGARTALGSHGRAFVEKNFARQALLQQYEECLLQALH